jgi:aminoglycoside phosphotransferase (APT) family kinase protein
MKTEQPIIDVHLVHRLVAAQFPEWAYLPIQIVENGGWDNRTFRLGERMVVRLPSAAEYVVQVEKEQWWLPKLAPLLPLPIPMPLAVGGPSDDYPWKWSIYRWIDGETAVPERIGDSRSLAKSLAQFLIALHRIDTAGGPPPGPNNFYRGGPLSIYDSETRLAISTLTSKISEKNATEFWEEALASTWENQPVWVHGDISAGNLLVQAGRLNAVIDFGMLAVGDPACDLSIAWTLFDAVSRDIFREMLPLDAGTWSRARGWTLWKALIVAAGHTETNNVEATRPWQIIREVLADHESK